MCKKQFQLISQKNNILSKEILLPSFSLEDLYYVSFRDKRFFLIKKTYKFFFIPTLLKIKKNKNFFLFQIENLSKISLELYCNNFLYWLKSYNKKIKQKLILKGLGFRSYLSDDKTEIFFKIGLSHIVSLKIPKKIFSVLIEKNFLIFEAYDKVVLGNFCKRIKRLKSSDVYKNKGFSSKNESLLLKPIKKT